MGLLSFNTEIEIVNSIENFLSLSCGDRFLVQALPLLPR